MRALCLNFIISDSNNGDPKWDHYYNARTVYKLKDLSPPSWQGLVDRFKSNDTLFQEWNIRKSTGTATSSCTGGCKRDTLCTLLGGTIAEVFACTGQQLNLNNLWQWFMNQIS